jgi:hypothetical protein
MLAINKNWRLDMLTKTKVALAAIAMLGAVSAVQAAGADKEEGVGGFRQGPEGQNLAAPTQRSVEPRAQAIEPRAQEQTEGRRARPDVFNPLTGENPAVERADPTDGDENGKK